MIRTFADKQTASLWRGEGHKRLSKMLQKAALRKLFMIDNASVLDDLRSPPGNRLEPLRGDLVGQWSIRINDQWRVCFIWHEGDAYSVKIVDYH